MDLSAVTPASAQPMTMSGASRVGGSGAESRMQGAIGSAAQLFGMSQSDLTSLLNSGQSLAGVASSKGISQTDLVSAIKQGVQQATPQGGTSGPSGSLLDRIANRIATHSGGQIGQAHHHHHGPGAGPAAATAGPTPDGSSGVSRWL